ncbi:MAG: carboxylate--amine ligase, partial [Chlamydiia bacterium]|nr:carboxylate--amine ligase [Chlamydiia bacterium]
MQHRRILLSAGRSPATLELARTFHRTGHSVYVADTSRWIVTRLSNTVTKGFVVPSPRECADAYIEGLIAIIEEESIDFFLPAWEDILYVSSALDRFPDTCQVFSAPFDTIHSLHCKWDFSKLAERLQLGVPRTWKIDSTHALNHIPNDIPLIFKPSYSRATQRIYRHQPGDPLPPIELSDSNPWVAQECLSGRKFCSYSICVDGNVQAHCCYPVLFAIEDSSCVYFEAVEHPGIKDWVKRFVRALNFTGQIAFDFFEEDDGRLCAIECNPRVTSGIHLLSEVEHLDRAFFSHPHDTLEPRPGMARQLSTGMVLYGWRSKGPALGGRRFLSTLLQTQDAVYASHDRRR